MKYIFDYVKVESPSIYETNLAGSQQIIDTQHLAQLRLQPGTSLNLTCKQHFLQIFSTLKYFHILSNIFGTHLSASVFLPSIIFNHLTYVQTLSTPDNSFKH